MTSDVDDACRYAGKLVRDRICDALGDKPTGTKFEVYVRKGLGTEAGDLRAMIEKYVVLPPGFSIDGVRLSGGGSQAAVIAVKEDVK